MKNFLTIMSVFMVMVFANAAFNPFPPTSLPAPTLTGKGALLTHDGAADFEFTGCADDEMLVWDIAETGGIKCTPKPGAGGSRLNLPSFPSFETGTEGICILCNISEEAFTVLVAPNNEKSLKITATANSAYYYLDTLRNTQWHEGMQLVKWVWIKTANSGVEIISRSNSTDSTTVKLPVLNDNKWHPYKLYDVVGAVNNGYKISIPFNGSNVYIDEVEIRPTNSSDFPQVEDAMSDWVDSGPIILSTTGTAPTKGTTLYDNMYSRRMGDSLEVSMDYQQSALGVAGTGAYLLALPDGLVADVTKFRTSGAQIAGFVGSGLIKLTGGVEIPVQAYIYQVDPSQISLQVQNNSGANIVYSHTAWQASTIPITDPNLGFTIKLSVPIVGWSVNKSTVVSQDTELTAETINTCDITFNMVTNALSSQSAGCPNGIAIAHNAVGQDSIVIPSGFYTAFPVVQCTSANQGGATGSICFLNNGAIGGTLTNIPIRTITAGGVDSDAQRLNVTLTKQETDYNKTATIIGKFKNINDTPLELVRAAGNGGEVTGGGDITFTEIEDTNGTWNGTQHTIDHDSLYYYNGMVHMTSSGANRVDMYIGGAFARRCGTLVTGADQHKFSCYAKLTTGQVVSFRAGGITLINNQSLHYLDITESPSMSSIVKNLLAEASQTKCQKKFLQADTSSNGNISDLQFNNLTIGKRYSVALTIRTSYAVTDTHTFYANSGGSGVCYVNQQSTQGGSNNPSESNYCTFQAAASTMLTTLASLHASNTVFGNGAIAETYVELCQLPDTHVETTEFN